MEFSDKTNQLLDYIEKTYLKGMVGNDSGQNIMEKMKLAENSNMVNMTGFASGKLTSLSLQCSCSTICSDSFFYKEFCSI